MKLSYTIYVVDDEKTIREGIEISLGGQYEIKTFSTAEDALSHAGKECPDLVLLDIGLPGMDGIRAISEFKGLDPNVQIVMITAYEDIQSVISAMKLGAYDYIVKPIHMDVLKVTINKVLEIVRLRKEVRILQEKFLKENLPFFIGESKTIQKVMDFIGMVAKSPDTPILISGETGTGKELIASAIHYRSPNFEGRLMTVNCAAIPKNLIESELFGYEKGAFSGASVSGKRGLIEEATNGTLFLDEVGDLSLEAQAKLLRFLEEGEFYRVGGTKTIRVKTRVISATNKEIDEMIEEGSFRKDLYFRLGVVRVEVPSLNERRDDVLPLAKCFLVEFCQKFGKTVTGLSKQAEEALLAYRWTGNVRELKNFIERGVLICRGDELSPHDLGIEQFPSVAPRIKADDEMSFPPLSHAGVDFPAIERSFEKFYFEEALRLTGGNESKAARLLKLNHHTFRYRNKNLEKPGHP